MSVTAEWSDGETVTYSDYRAAMVDLANRTRNRTPLPDKLTVDGHTLSFEDFESDMVKALSGRR